LFFLSTTEITDYSITELDLSTQGLRELPNDIHLYKNLIILDCSINRLTNLPRSQSDRLSARSALELPSSLQRLDCYDNPFYNELGYELTIETLPRYNEEINNLKMINYVMK
jgi:Leucine-rich repeat (LRR) protein